ncbi:TPA: hypothetical protein SMQ47_003669 [Proteus mirabilis]|nr:hypothetical protein [Proteus mirabilis]
MKSKEFFALSEDERRKRLAGVDRLKIDLGVHADKLIRSRLDDAASGKLSILDAQFIYDKNEPEAEFIILKFHNPHRK